MTPGYIRKEVNFEENLARAMGKSSMNGLRSDQRHIPIGDTKRGQNPVIMHDVNAPNVDIELEMAASAENQLLYTTAAKLVSGKFKSLRTVIRGRG
jgi:flagellar basal-body rod protein FlgB